MKCGETGIIPDCVGKIGRWRIIYNIPTAPKVRYRYGSGAWNEIVGGVSYQNINNPALSGQCAGKNYRLGLYVKVRRFGRIFGSCPGQNEADCWLVEQISSGIIGAISSITVTGFDNSPCKPSSGGGWKKAMFTIVHSGGTTTKFSEATSWRTTEPTNYNQCQYSSSGGDYYYFRNFGAAQAFYERIDGQPDNCSPGTCTFKVFDCNNTLLYENTASTCPEAEVIPSQYLPENEQTIFANPLTLGFSFLTTGLEVFEYVDGGKKCADINYFVIGSPIFRFNIKKVCSPDCSTLFPKVCWDCEGCDRCPQETCLKVRNGDKICCYGKNGKVIKVVDADCETADC